MSAESRPVMGELLLREGILTEAQLAKALDAAEALGRAPGLPPHPPRLRERPAPQPVHARLHGPHPLRPRRSGSRTRPSSISSRATWPSSTRWSPWRRTASLLTVAIADLDNPSIIPALEELTGLTIDPVVCPRETVIRALEQFYGVAKDPGVVRNIAGDHLFVARPSEQAHPAHPLVGPQARLLRRRVAPDRPRRGHSQRVAARCSSSPTSRPSASPSRARTTWRTGSPSRHRSGRRWTPSSSSSRGSRTAG